MTTAKIELQEVSVRIPIYAAPTQRSLKHTALRFTTGGRLVQSNNIQEVLALNSITLNLGDGIRLGLKGHNGSGKTTLLRVIAGILPPTTGTVKTLGRTRILINPSMGLSPEMTGREFIRVQSMINGIHKEEVAKKMPSIIEFTELGSFIDLPVRTYSTGMITRLSFSIVTAYSADILLLDEGLGAGDHSFQMKAQKRFEGWLQNASIIVLASHSEALINSICTSSLTLCNGRIDHEDGGSPT